MTLPMENNTTAVVTKLAGRSLRHQKRRNCMVVVAVALAAFLLCFAAALAVFTSSALKEQVDDTWELVYSDVTEENIAALQEVPDFATVGTYYLVGSENDARGGEMTFVYSDAETFWMFRSQMELEEGRLPEAADEIAVSNDFVERYAPGAGIGDTVQLDTEGFRGDYVLSGLLESAVESDSATVLISHAMLEGWAGYDPANYRGYVHFSGNVEPDEDAMLAYGRQTAEELGIAVPGTNVMYFRYYSGIDASTLPLVGIVALLVLIGSCVVIQSIFRISVQDKIQSYGQLRTLGATRRQIKRIVRREGRLLGLTGSAAGAVLGAAVAAAVMPAGFRLLPALGVMVLTVLLCLIVVALSIRTPVKIAAGISPLEAVRYAPGREPARRRGKSGRLDPVALGVRNFARDGKRAASITLSLSIGGILLLVVSSILLIRSPEMQARQSFPDGDYKIYLDAGRPESEVMAEGNPLNEELKQKILAIDGVTAVLPKRQSMHAEYFTESESDTSMCDMLTQDNRAQIEAALVEGTMPADDHSILVAEKIDEALESVYLGATVQLSLGGDPVPVTVVGILDDMKIPDGHGKAGMDAPNLYAPEAIFREQAPGVENFDYSWSIVSDPQKAQTVQAGLEAVVAGNADLGLDTFAEKAEYLRQVDAFGIGAFQVLSWLIFLFGVVNLINTTLSNQVARQRENNILRTVGLTRRQLYQMTVCEGLCYALTALAATLAVGLPIAIVACRFMSAATYGGRILPYQFPFLEMGLFADVLLILEGVLSWWTIRRQKSQSLIEQLRTGE